MKLTQSIKNIVKTLFQKRNVIIMSERSTSHMSMSGKLQFVVFVLAIFVIGAGSFSTGKYMAARQVISDQGETIKSVAKSRIEENYNYGVPSLVSSNVLKNNHHQKSLVPLSSPDYSFSTMDEDKLIARIAFLENHVRELNQTNKEIVNVVRQTADGHISDLEKIISQTGLSAKTLKQHARQENKIRKRAKARTSVDGPKGGPYIPENWNSEMQRFVEDLETSTDEIYTLRKIIEALPTARPMAASARQTSGFGYRRDPFTRRSAMHSGVDFSSKTTPQITATADGIIKTAKRAGSYGNLVEIEHGLGLTTRYGHLSKILVAPGQRVKEGQLIGIQGSTGRSTGAHLHYEVRFNSRPLNPKGFLAAGKAYGEANVSKK